MGAICLVGGGVGGSEDLMLRAEGAGKWRGRPGIREGCGWSAHWDKEPHINGHRFVGLYCSKQTHLFFSSWEDRAVLDPSRPGSKQGALPWRAEVSQETPSPLSPLPPFRQVPEGQSGQWRESTGTGSLWGSCPPPPRQTRGGVITWLPLFLSGPFTGPYIAELLSKLLMGR